MAMPRTLARKAEVLESMVAKLLEQHRKLYSSWIVDWEKEQRRRLESQARNTISPPLDTSKEAPSVRLLTNL
jgi:hypothetical protein